MMCNGVLASAPCFKGVPIYQTEGIRVWTEQDLLAQVQVAAALQKFLLLDWGSISEEDISMNSRHLRKYDEIFARYETSSGDIYIIADGRSDGLAYSHITVLFPGEL